MIRAVYRRDRYALQVTGHAHSAPAGEDLVCAAASALVCTLAQAAERLAERGILTDSRVRLAPGEAEIVCLPAEGFQCLVHSVMDSLCLGLELLAEEYGACVQWEQAERSEE